MTLRECYDKMNGDFDEAMNRLMSEKLIERFMLKFPSDRTMEELRTAVSAGNIEDSFRAAHTMKGVAANLSFKALFDASHELTEQLRPKNEAANQELVCRVESAYMLVMNTIQEYRTENGK